MKIKIGVYFVLACAILSAVSECMGVGTRDITEVRKNAVLNEQDKQVIDKFVGSAVGELVNIKDFSTASNIRGIILANSSSSVDSARQQFSDQFSKSGASIFHRR